MVIVLAVSCICVTCCSSMASDTYPGMMETFHISQEVCILSISIFVMGLGTGPREYLSLCQALPTHCRHKLPIVTTRHHVPCDLVTDHTTQSSSVPSQSSLAVSQCCTTASLHFSF